MKDYKRITHMHERASTRLVRTVCIVIGTMAVIVGVVGIIIPLLPTTPFLLLAAACYARSSRRLYDWLISNRWCGRYVRSYRAGEGIPVRVKALTILLLWLTIGFSALIIVSNVIVKITLLLVAIGVTKHVMLLPTYKATGQKKISIEPVCRDCTVED
jgi:uncharacterized membrane protein YbaN (DUF454 family)